MNHESQHMTSAEVAALFRVDAKTVARWAQAGKLSSFRTIGNHWRFYRAEVMALIQGDSAGDMDALIDATREEK